MKEEGGGGARVGVDGVDLPVFAAGVGTLVFLGDKWEGVGGVGKAEFAVVAFGTKHEVFHFADLAKDGADLVAVDGDEFAAQLNYGEVKGGVEEVGGGHGGGRRG